MLLVGLIISLRKFHLPEDILGVVTEEVVLLVLSFVEVKSTEINKYH